MDRRARAAIALALCAGGCASPSTRPIEEAWRPLASELYYPLDEIDRRAESGPDGLACPETRLVRYEGSELSLSQGAPASPYFIERLILFERVVREVAEEVYGRAPAAIEHYGIFNCRRVRGSAKLSEHALGNAIDVSGFRFEAGPGPIKGAFRVSVEEHWGASVGEARRHARFLRALATRLAARPDIFRGIIGPGASGHDDHFHFDMGPRYFIEIER